MRKLTLLSPINARPLKRTSFYQLLRSENNQQSKDENVGRYESIVNQPIPLPLNDNAAASDRNGVSVSDSEVLAVSSMSGGCWTWLARKWWSCCKHGDLIQAILAMLYQIPCNLYRVFGL